jgi:hypothetical protein
VIDRLVATGWLPEALSMDDAAIAAAISAMLADLAKA